MIHFNTTSILAAALTAACFVLPGTSFAMPYTAMETVKDLNPGSNSSRNLQRIRMDSTGTVTENTDSTIVSENNVDADFGRDRFADVTYKHVMSWVIPPASSFIDGELTITGHDIEAFGGPNKVIVDGIHIGNLLTGPSETSKTTSFILSGAFLNTHLLLDGMLNIFIDSNQSRDRLAIDFSKLTVNYNAHSAVPEPSTMILLGSGLVGLVGYRLRQTKK